MNPHLLNSNSLKNKVILWILAFIITAASAVYQRVTGPTYPYRNKVQLSNIRIPVELKRSETVGSRLPIVIEVVDKSIMGSVLFKRYKSNDQWTQISMTRKNGKLTARLPSQPISGKLMYFVFLHKGGKRVSLSGERPVVARYQGDVPAIILIPHILFMFLAMLLSNRTAFKAFDKQGDAYQYILWTVGFLLLGGFIFGPLVQKYAFGEFWTGIPFGYDLTDNKTLVALIGWALAWAKNRNGRQGKGWIFLAAIIMLAVFLIPHSVLGSELDYTKMN